MTHHIEDRNASDIRREKMLTLSDWFHRAKAVEQSKPIGGLKGDVSMELTVCPVEIRGGCPKIELWRAVSAAIYPKTVVYRTS